MREARSTQRSFETLSRLMKKSNQLSSTAKLEDRHLFMFKKKNENLKKLMALTFLLSEAHEDREYFLAVHRSLLNEILIHQFD